MWTQHSLAKNKDSLDYLLTQRNIFLLQLKNLQPGYKRFPESGESKNNKASLVEKEIPIFWKRCQIDQGPSLQN